MKPVAGSCLGGILNSLTQTCCLLCLPFCGPSIINHYLCDTNPLLKLTCSDGHPHELLFITFNGPLPTTVLLAVTSHAYILVSILSIRSARG